jgi:hypothetical protein
MADDGLLLIGDDMWGAPCLAYNLQAHFSDDALRMISVAQTGLEQMFPYPLNLCPLTSLHVSVYGLVPVVWADPGKEEYWQEISTKVIADLGRLCEGSHAFQLQFSRLRVTPRAVIAIAADPSGTIEKIREHFHQTARHPALPMQSYDIVHTTLARFRFNAFLPNEGLAQIESRQISIPAAITHLKIVRERIYPSIEFDNITSMRLA